MKKQPSNTTMGEHDWSDFDALTDEDIARGVASDPDAQPLTREQLRCARRAPDLRRIRMKSGMSQAKFAKAFELSLRTVQDWEQQRFIPDRAARALLRVIDYDHEFVMNALKPKPRHPGSTDLPECMVSSVLVVYPVPPSHIIESIRPQ